MPLNFTTSDCNGNSTVPGPYDFTAFIAHKLVLSLTPTSSNHHTHRTAFAVGVHNPDGVVVANPALRATVQRLVHGKWVSSAPLAPPFSFGVKWLPAQRGKLQSIRVVVAGPGYLTATSRTVRVRGV
jgi:hypothetical protein